MSPASSPRLRWLRLATGLLSFLHLAARGEPVVVPGGPASIRRLLDIPSPRPEEAFFLDVHRTLVALSNPAARWSDNVRRVAVVRFADDLAEWRTEQGCPATLSTRAADWKRTRRALSWLGVKVRGEGERLELEPETDPDALRRHAFLEALGYPLPDVLRRLRNGQEVPIACSDGEADLPFGLTVWRDTLDLDPDELTREKAFVELVRNVPASRMLVALHGVDGRTREEARRLIRVEKGSAGGWRLLLDRALEGFSRFPEALVIRDGRFDLPGGADADAVWSDVVGTPTSDRAGFLTALFAADGGKAAYVVDALRQLPPAAARAFVLGRTGGGEKAVKRFRRLYGSVERAGGNFELSQRDPYDFTHLVRFLKLSDDGEIVVPGGASLWHEALSGSGFPASEAELAEVLADAARRQTAPEDVLRRLFRREVAGAVRDVPAQKRFLLVSGLLEARPVLRDPGTILLLFRGTERFLPAFAPLEDVPLDDPAVVRRYLFTLHRLDTQGADREDEVRAGLLLASAELVAATCRSGALSPPRARAVFASLLALPLFATPETSPAGGIDDFEEWLRSVFVAGLREEESAFLDGARREKAAREAEYRASVESRDRRIVERRAAERAVRETVREEAEALFVSLTTPVCGGDDSLAGPMPIPALLDADWLSAELETEGLRAGASGAAGGTDPDLERRFARARATLLVSEALRDLRLRARPLPPDPPLPRMDGELPDVHPVIDTSLPLPTLVRVDVPAAARSADELLSAALSGFRLPVTLRWRGAAYRFDPSADANARRAAFVVRQRCARLEGLERASNALRAVLAASGAGDPAGTRAAIRTLREALSVDSTDAAAVDERVSAVVDDARGRLEDLAQLTRPKALAKLRERIEPVQALRAERALEALVLHVYSAASGDPAELVYGDPLLVRRHSLRWSGAKAGIFESPFGPTRIELLGAGKGSRIAGSLSGVPDALGLLHVEQLVLASQTALGSEHVKAGLVGPVARVTPARLDDDALRFVALSCDAAEELARSLESRSEEERQEAWSALARDLVPQARIAALSAAPASEVGESLTPTDLYRIGRRLALARGEGTGAGTPSGSAAAARAARDRLVARFGEGGAVTRLAELGPRPVSYAGRARLADIDMPPNERLTEYRFPQLYADRLYDIKVAAARMAFRAGDAAPLLGLYLEPSLDELLARVRTAHVYDWRPLARGAAALGAEQRDRLLEAALEAGRIHRLDEEEQTP